MAYQNAAGINVTGIVTLSSSGVPTGSTVTNHGVVVAGASNTVSSVAPGTSGNVLTSNGTDWVSSAASSGGITTIDGDSGSATGSTVLITAGTSIFANGASVKFTGSSSTLNLALTDASDNIFIGNSAGVTSGAGSNNVGLGSATLTAMSGGTGIRNVAIGSTSLLSLATGSYNSCLGRGSGSSYTSSESSNICINSTGTASESNVLRIGQATGTGDQELNKAFIHGIRGISLAGADQIIVNDSNGQAVSIASGSAGQVLQSGGSGTNPAFSTATYPSTAGTSGNVLTSDGTNWTSSAPSPSATFTPVIAFGGASTGVTYVRQIGKYTITGKLLSFNIALQLSSKGSSTGVATITGLPFACANDNATYQFACTIQGVTIATATYFAAELDANTSTIKLNWGLASTGALTQLTDAEFGGGDFVNINGLYFLP